MIWIRPLLHRLISPFQRLRRNSTLPKVDASSTPSPRVPTFHWYKTSRNEAGELVIIHENNFGEEIRSRYLNNAVIWLLGYDARIPLAEQRNDQPIRSQATACFWQMGWNIVDLVRARDLLVNNEELAQEIDRKLLHSEWGALAFLINHAEVRANRNVCWDRRLYETAVVLEALFSIIKHYEPARNPDLFIQIDPLIRAGLRWALREIESPLEAQDQLRPWGVTLRMLGVATKTRFRRMVQPYLVLHVEQSLIELYRGSKTSNTAGIGDEKPDYNGDIMHGLAIVLLEAEDQLPPNLAHNVRVVLTYGLEMLEKRFEYQEFSGPRKSRALAQYPLMWSALYSSKHKHINKMLIVQTFSDLVTDGSVFYEDGSIQHSSYMTTYFVNALIILSNSILAVMAIPEIYSQFLQSAPRQTAEERKRNFELERQIYRLQREQTELSNDMRVLREQRRIIFSALFVVIWIVLAASIAPWLGILTWSPFEIMNVEALLELFISVTVVVASLAWATSRFLLRDPISN